MISSAIWDKSARVNLSQIAREKSCDYLLIIYMQKFDSNFPLIVLISCHGSLVPPTLTLLVEK